MASEFDALTEAAEEFILVIERLYRTRRIRLEIFGRSLRNRLPTQLMDTLTFAAAINPQCTPANLLGVLTLVDTLEMGPCLIDLGDLVARYGSKTENMEGELGGIRQAQEARPVVINGFGRIGRLLTRQMFLDGCEPFLQLKGIRVRPGIDLARRAALLKYDSVHGEFAAKVEVDANRDMLIINDQPIQVYEETEDPPDYTGIHKGLMLDSTGVRRDEESLSGLLNSQISQVLLTAPGKGIPNYVYGVSDLRELDAPVLAAASCTTNAAVPVLNLLDEEIGIEYAHLETVHAYTNDQNLVDNAHSSARRGRAATSNIVLTSSGAAQAVVQILPQLENRISVHAVRVPVANVSLLICHLHLGRNSTVEQLSELIVEGMALPEYRELIGFSREPEAVSSDFIGDRHACVVDGPALRVDGERALCYIWYDNEAGYCAQVLRLAQAMAADVATLIRYGPLGKLIRD